MVSKKLHDKTKLTISYCADTKAACQYCHNALRDFNTQGKWPQSLRLFDTAALTRVLCHTRNALPISELTHQLVPGHRCSAQSYLESNLT